MKQLVKALVVAIIGLSSVGVEAAGAADNSRVVCGTPLRTDGPLTWGIYSKDPLPGNLPAVYESLGNLLGTRASKWTPNIQNVFVEAFNELAAGGFARSDFKFSTDASLPPKQMVFKSTSRQFEMPLSESAPGCTNADESRSRIEAGNFVLLVERTLVEFDKDDFKAAAARIKKLEEIYDRYLFEGFPMFPWEAWANSAFLTDKSIANGPPRNMLVLVHPSAGMVGSIDADTSSDAGGVLAIEPIGWIRYSTNYRHWYGASLLAVFPTDRNIGYGMAFNYDNFKLGVTWHDENDSEHDGLALFFGFDLYQLISDKKRSYNDYIDALKGVEVKSTN